MSDDQNLAEMAQRLEAALNDQRKQLDQKVAELGHQHMRRRKFLQRHRQGSDVIEVAILSVEAERGRISLAWPPRE